MTVHPTRILPLHALVALAVSPTLAPGSARADRIDGYWCRATKQLFIEGPRIVTPGGKDMRGDYDRHGFSYVVPAGEEGAGATVTMMMVNEDLVQLIFSTRPADAQDWKRCGGRIS